MSGHNTAVEFGDDALKIFDVLDGVHTNDNASSSFVIRGAAGTGKTLVAAHAVARAIKAGIPAEKVLVVCHSSSCATHMSELIATQLRVLDSEHMVTPPVKTVHSLAHLVLRKYSIHHNMQFPRLMTGSEMEFAIAGLLEGERELTPHLWPSEIRQSLGSTAMAREVRDLLSRAFQRGAHGEDIVAWGRATDNPTWGAVGEFADRYDQAMSLADVESSVAGRAAMPALCAAELVSTAHGLITSDASLLADFSDQFSLLVVEDTQHLDPVSSQLLSVIMQDTPVNIATVDEDQVVFDFRGAQDHFVSSMLEHGAQTVVLERNHRMNSDILRLCAHLAGPLSAPAGCLSSYTDTYAATNGRATTSEIPAVITSIHDSEYIESESVARFLRQCHTHMGIAWKDMAIVGRSGQAVADAYRRALSQANIPAWFASGASFAADPAVRTFISILSSCFKVPRDESFMRSLLSGPIGRMDPLVLRSANRFIERTSPQNESVCAYLAVMAAADEQPGTLVARLQALDSSLVGLPEGTLSPILRVAGVLDAVDTSLSGSAEEILWRAWASSGLEQYLVAKSEGSGADSAAAHSNLDAMLGLFGLAADFVDRTPGGNLNLFLDFVAEQELSVMIGGRHSAAADAVCVTSAHTALGREFQVVAVVGVGAGIWPNKKGRDGMLAAEELCDLIDGRFDPGVSSEVTRRSRIQRSFQEERRLLISACTRARDHLWISAVHSTGDDGNLPSQFFNEAHEFAGEHYSQLSPTEREPLPQWSPLDVVGLLKQRVLSHQDSQALDLLTDLTSAGVWSADVTMWKELSPSITVDDQATEKPVARISPSSLEKMGTCSLRWFLDSHVSASPQNSAIADGKLLHFIAENLRETGWDSGLSAATFQSYLQDYGDQIYQERSPSVTKRRHDMDKMIVQLQEWVESRVDTRVAGREVRFQLLLTDADQPVDVAIVGTMDRVEVDAEGHAIVVDFKTSATPASKADAQANKQLQLYQFAVDSGAISEISRVSAGAMLAYPKSSAKKATSRQREQQALTDHDQLTAELFQSGRISVGSTFHAVQNSECSRCNFHVVCPTMRGNAHG